MCFKIVLFFLQKRVTFASYKLASSFTYEKRYILWLYIICPDFLKDYIVESARVCNNQYCAIHFSLAGKVRAYKCQEYKESEGAWGSSRRRDARTMATMTFSMEAIVTVRLSRQPPHYRPQLHSAPQTQIVCSFPFFSCLLYPCRRFISEFSNYLSTLSDI